MSIDPERMKKWEANITPVPSAERLKTMEDETKNEVTSGKRSDSATCSVVDFLFWLLAFTVQLAVIIFITALMAGGIIVICLCLLEPLGMTITRS